MTKHRYIFAPLYVLMPVLTWLMVACSQPKEQAAQTPEQNIGLSFEQATGLADTLQQALKLAEDVVARNVRRHKDGLLTDSAGCLFAGDEYFGPWARDGAHNLMAGAALLEPSAARNTLLSLMKQDAKGRLIFGGEYWDNLLQAEAHLAYYYQTGDSTLLRKAYEATLNTLADREALEFDAKYGLFRGAAGFNDGISGYPDLYARTGTYTGGQWVSNIKKWPEVAENAAFKSQIGFGLPMMPLSTNVAHYMGYKTAIALAEALGKPADNALGQKAELLKQAINKQLWDSARGTYRYYVDPNGNSDHQEAMGLAMTLLTDVASPAQAQVVLKTTMHTPAGIPCLWPGFERYASYQQPDTTNPALGRWQKHYPRHAQTIWGMNQGLWAMAALKHADTLQFAREMLLLARHAVRDKDFYELFHPDNGLPYGGIQEDNTGKNILWKSMKGQVWSATAFWRCLWQGWLGMSFNADGLSLKPLGVVPKYGLGAGTLAGMQLRGQTLSVQLKGHGTTLSSATLNGSTLPLSSGAVQIPWSAWPKKPVTLELTFTP